MLDPQSHQLTSSRNAHREGDSVEFLVGVCHSSQNPDPVSDQNIFFPIPIFRPGLKILYPTSDPVSTLSPYSNHIVSDGFY